MGIHDSVDELYAKRGGTGGRGERFELLTNGQVRVEVDAIEPALRMPPISSTPAADTAVGAGTFFFRNDGAGKSQFCVRFPSGVVQIISSEP